jgi:hypothetical protein
VSLAGHSPWIEQARKMCAELLVLTVCPGALGILCAALARAPAHERCRRQAPKQQPRRPNIALSVYAMTDVTVLDSRSALREMFGASASNFCACRPQLPLEIKLGSACPLRRGLTTA